MVHINKNKIPYYILLVFGVLLFTMGIANHYFFRTVTYDYGTYNFGFWDYAHLQISPSTLTKGTFLQDHFSFTLMYFVPIYWLFNWLTGTYTLILIQYTMVLIAAWYSYKLVMLKSKDLWLGIGMMLYYFLLLGRYTTFSCDCNIAVISACFIPVFLYYFELKKYIHSLVILILSLFSRENIPIWFIFIFIVLIIDHRKDKKVILYSIIGILISLVYFLLLFKVFIPSIETTDKQYSLFNYGALGANPAEAISFILHHPIESVKMLFVNHLHDTVNDGIKAEFYWVYLISGGFVLFFKPKYLIWFIPLVAQKELNDNFVRWGITTYYSIEIVTLLPLSVFLALSELKWKYLKYGLAASACLATLYMTLYKLEPKNCRVPWGANPAKERIYDKDFFKAPFNVRKVNNLLALIPADAKVSSCDQILPHLSQRQSIYFFPDVRDADYIVFSMYLNNWMHSPETNEQKRIEYLTNPNWEIIAKEYPVVLLKKTKKPNEILKKLTFISSSTIKCDFENTNESKKIVVFPDGTKADTISNRTEEEAHNGKYALKLTQANPFGVNYGIKADPKVNFVQVTVWQKPMRDQHQIVASCGKDFYQTTHTSIEQDSSGWAKLNLSFLMPETNKDEVINIYLWNSSTEPAYFDDLIIKKY